MMGRVAGLGRLWAIAALGIAVAAPVHAAGPTAEELIKALTPTPGVTRGSRPVVSAAGQGAGHAAAGHAVAGQASLTLTFATGSAALTPQAMSSLDALGSALSSTQLQSYKFLIEGHTDTVGTPAGNRALSQARAEAAAAYLEHRFAIPASRLETVGRGEEGLAVPTGPQVAEPRNRRVQVINLGPA